MLQSTDGISSNEAGRQVDISNKPSSCFLVPEHNVIMVTVKKHSNIKIFTEKLLLLLNRGGEVFCCFIIYPVWDRTNGRVDLGNYRQRKIGKKPLNSRRFLLFKRSGLGKRVQYLHLRHWPAEMLAWFPFKWPAIKRLPKSFVCVEFNPATLGSWFLIYITKKRTILSSWTSTPKGCENQPHSAFFLHKFYQTSLVIDFQWR